MSQTIEIPDELFTELKRHALEQGKTPDELSTELIAASLLRDSTGLVDAERGQEQPLSEALRGYIGIIDSTQEPYSNDDRSALGDMVADKLARQGIKAPWQR